MSSSAMHVAKTGLNSQQTKMQVIANNLANVNTTGFKKDRVSTGLLASNQSFFDLIWLIGYQFLWYDLF